MDMSESKQSWVAPKEKSVTLEGAITKATWIAYTAPFLVFMGLLALSGFIGKFATDLGGSDTSLWLTSPEYWLYPLQTVVCLAIIARYRSHYQFNGCRPLIATLVGLVVLALWISPQWLLGAEPRLYGFDPTPFEKEPVAYWFHVGFRFLRLVVAVPLLEEIFWRSFLMRWLVNERFTEVAFGSFSAKSFFGVAILFAMAHSGPDFVAALATGIIYNGLAVWTRSLGACVFAHAVTNFGLGLYIMFTRQWGFW